MRYSSLLTHDTLDNLVLVKQLTRTGKAVYCGKRRMSKRDEEKMTKKEEGSSKTSS